MDHLTSMAAEAALRKMFQPNAHLSICTLDQLLKVTKVVPPPAEYDALSLLHCVSWRDMSAELRQHAARTIMGWFQLPPFDPWVDSPLAILAVSEPPAPAGRLQRWLGKVK